jgi:hypothetical protein
MENDHILRISRAAPASSPGNFDFSVGANGTGTVAADADLRIQAGVGWATIFRHGSSTERARIDGSGRLLVGTSSSQSIPSANGVSNARQLQLDSFNYVGIGIVSNANAANATRPATLTLSRTGSDSDRTTAVINNDELGAIQFTGYSGGHLNAASIIATVDSGTVSGTSMPTRLVFSTTADGAASPTERMRIDSSGRVGIGTTSPGYLITAATSADGVDGVSVESPSLNGVIRLRADGTNGNAIRVGGVGAQGNTLRFLVGGDAERARIDSSGRLLVGTSSVVTTTYAGNGNLQIHSDGVAGAQIFTHRSTGSEYPGILELARSRGSLATPTAVIADDKVGALVYHGYDGSNYIRAASIDAVIDGTPGLNDMPGRLVFSTTADGASSPTERMRLTSTGQLRLAGAGITFNGDTATANELDDYEEGTWTPTVIGTTTAGTGTYTTQNGKYTKIGGKVFVEAAIVWTAHTGTGAMWFGNLPFTSASTGAGPGVSLGRVSNIALTASNVLLAYVASNSTIMPLRQYPVGGGAEATVPIDTAGEVNFSATYMVV